jgi:hypothetical protein
MAVENAGLLVRATGEAFAARQYDLRSVDLVITNYRILLDQTIPFAIGQSRLSYRAKEQISYQIEFRHGSLELLSTIALSVPPIVAAVASDGGFQLAHQVAKLFNAVVTFRRAWANVQQLLEERKELSETPKLNLSINLEGVSQGDGNTINVSPVVLLAANATKHTVDRLVGGIDGQKVESFSVESERGSKTVLERKDEVLLGTDLEELPTTVDILGKLYEVNFITKKGWLVTGDGRVPITWEESVRRDIRAHADRPNVAFRVRPVVDHRRFGVDDSPVGYHVLRVWVPQGSLLNRPKRVAGSRRGRS